MSLYQKYRPQSFADVIGQDHIVTTLENAATQDKLSHAYLFAGSRGTGKTSVARILAKILLTKNIEDETLQKQIIKGVEEGSIVDLIEIDAASNRGIDDIRDLIEKIQFSPVVGSAKVYIIDEAHMLTKDAFPALLKTLEEPPPYAFFILATTELQKIPATIQSRCQRFLFRQIREEDLIRGLQKIADAEHITIDRSVLRAIAHHAQGGMRDAISLFDQLRSLKKITAEDIRERLGEGTHEHVEGILAALQECDQKKLLEIIEKVEESAIPLETLTRQLLGAIRIGLHGAIEKKESFTWHERALTALLECIRDIRIAPVPGLVLEATLLSLCSSGDLNERSGKKPIFGKKKTEETQSKASASAEASAKKSQPTETKEAAPEKTVASAAIEAPEVSMEKVQEHWPKMIEETNPPSVRMSLKNGRILHVREKSIVLSFSSTFHRDKVANTEACRAIEGILESIFKRPLHLECIVEEGESVVRDEKKVDLAEAVAEIF